MRPLVLALGILLCVPTSSAHAQSTDRLDLAPVPVDFCKTCIRVATATFAGIGTATLYQEVHPPPDGGSTYWLAIATKKQTVRGAVYEVYPGGCGAGTCISVDAITPSLRSFSYLVEKTPVKEVGLELEVDRTRDVLEAEPPRHNHEKQWLFFVCGAATDTGAWQCRETGGTCERAAWARSAVPAVQTTCTEDLGRVAP